MKSVLMKAALVSMMLFSVTACPDSTPKDAKGNATALCTQSFVDTYSQAKASLALFSSGSAKASDEDTQKDCKALIAAKPDFCQVDCAKISSDSICPSKGGSVLNTKDVVDECKSFQRRAKGKQ